MSNSNLLVILDFDGTLFDDFFMRDKEIIAKVFEGNKFVMFIDLLARKINDLGIVKNNNFLLRFRIFIYSLFVKKSFKRSLVEYRRLYRYYAKKSINKNIYMLDKLNAEGYKVIILSNNMYTNRIDMKYELITNINKYIELEELYNEHGNSIRYIIGDNFLDDVNNGYKFNIKTIYMGKGFLVKRSKKIFRKVTTIKEAINIILNQDENEEK